MKQCTYCGKAYPPEASVCAVDGQPLKNAITPSPAKIASPKPFFRWKPASVSLIVLAVIFWGAAVLNFWIIWMTKRLGGAPDVSYLLWGSFWNVVAGVLCMVGRHLLKSATRMGCAYGAFAIAAALIVVMRNWLSALLAGRPQLPVVEAFLIWPWLLYALLYAVRAMRPQVGADSSILPDASTSGSIGSKPTQPGAAQRKTQISVDTTNRARRMPS